jgi:hypothetical protein
LAALFAAAFLLPANTPEFTRLQISLTTCCWPGLAPPRALCQTSRLSEELRRADSVQKEARAAANSAGLRVLQLEQRVGQLSTDKQAAAQVRGRAVSCLAGV